MERDGGSNWIAQNLRVPELDFINSQYCTSNWIAQNLRVPEHTIKRPNQP